MNIGKKQCILTGSMITFKHYGDFSKTKKYLHRVAHASLYSFLKQYGQEGVDALSAATPKDSGETASSWYYDIIQTRSSVKIEWKNSNIVDGVPIAVIIQYGHATRNGGYVQGIDYINPALRPIFEKITESVWKELTRD